MKSLLITLVLFFNFGLFGQELQSTSRELKTEVEQNSTEESKEAVEGLQSKTPKENRKKKTLNESPVLLEEKQHSNSKKIKN